MTPIAAPPWSSDQPAIVTMPAIAAETSSNRTTTNFVVTD